MYVAMTSNKKKIMVLREVKDVNLIMKWAHSLSQQEMESRK